LDVILAVPPKYQEGLRLEEVEEVFPYGECHITIQDGGMIAKSGIAIETLGDNGDDMVVVCCSCFSTTISNTSQSLFAVVGQPFIAKEERSRAVGAMEPLTSVAPVLSLDLGNSNVEAGLWEGAR
ncbi:hypothetical protein TrRE_jg8049, partial [Triparma retinervis]